jgi:hypothetical protein
MNYNTGKEEEFFPVLIREKVNFGGIELGEMDVLYQKGKDTGELHIFNDEYDYNHSQFKKMFDCLTAGAAS